MITEFKSLYDLFEAIPDEQAAIDHFTAIRWKDGEFCPYCGSVRLYHFADKRTHKCGDCRNRFSIKVGTIFEDTKIGIRKWLAAIWLITSHKKGIASTTLARDIKVTQKTAWFMLHRLREAAATPSFNEPLQGDVEADTTFVGGKEKNKHANKRTSGSQGGANKSVILGMIERDGELRTAHVEDTKAKTLQSEVRKNVRKGSAILTDDDRSFHGLDKDFNHLSVNHSTGEYVRLGGFVHTNSIESVWALLKRQIYGIHHWVSPKHLNRYIAEMTWRFNRRAFEEGSRLNALIACSSGRLTYKELIA